MQIEHSPFSLISSLDCPPGFASFDNSCYFFIKRGLTWYEAQHACAAHPDTRLVIIESPEEQQFLTNTIIANSGNGYDYHIKDISSYKDQAFSFLTCPVV